MGENKENIENKLSPIEEAEKKEQAAFIKCANILEEIKESEKLTENSNDQKLKIQSDLKLQLSGALDEWHKTQDELNSAKKLNRN